MMEQASLPYTDQLDAAKSFIMANDDFLVVSHILPDGDASSSTLAVGLLLRHLNKRFTMINEGSTPGKFNYLWGSDQIINYSVAPPNRVFDHVISVDCADFSRIGKVSTLFAESYSLLNIDHHPTNDFFGEVNVIKEDAAATAEILYDLAQRLNITWSIELGNCLYTGLLTDTGGFRYANTTPKVMSVASEMLQYGVDGNELADHLLERLSFSHIILLKKALANLAFSNQRRISWISVSQQDIAEAEGSNEDLEGLVNYPRNIEGVEVGILFKEVDGLKYKISMRSAGKVDVAEIAQKFGGGGHVRAAGCSLEGTLEQVTKQLLEEVGLALA
jgi:phosphoesterase RecJ-like protein